MKVLIVGGGGREHALAWKFAQSDFVKQVFVAPGNAGTATEPKTQNVDISAEDPKRLVQFAQEKKINLTVVGPEVPLVNGIADLFEEQNLLCFGPSKSAARLEGSKEFAKQFMAKHEIPTAEYASFSNVNDACEYINRQNLPIVVKADGLAAGKGVVIANSYEEANQAVFDMLIDRKFGESGQRVVVEQFIEGEEASFICMVNGGDILPLASSQDHKAVGEQDTGPNTGGMGAYSPAPVIDSTMHDSVMASIIQPTVEGLRQEGIDYKGFLYAGLMIDSQGMPYVLEYNCRLGDPETQPILMRLESDLVDLILTMLEGDSTNMKARWNEQASLGVVAASKGYPGSYPTGAVISGLESLNEQSVKVFHAGTNLNQSGQVVVSGGRVFCLVALGDDIATAQASAYQSLSKISFDNMYIRRDIGFRALARMRESCDS